MRKHWILFVAVAGMMSVGVVASVSADIVHCEMLGACSGTDECPESWGSVEGEGCDFECCPNPDEAGECFELFCTYDDP